MSAFKNYLKTIETALKTGNATEHTHRPALKALLETLDLHVTATNEPKRIACGAPDYLVSRDMLTLGYIEAKDVGKSLYEAERSDQLKRYRRALDNLILTDYLEFRWYVDGELRQEARLARPQMGGKLKVDKSGLKAVEALLQNFLAHQPESINTPKMLAERMARLTHIIRDIIIAAFETEQASMLLQNWREAFTRVLIADLGLPDKTPDFADMFAQTLAYGLFTARVMNGSTDKFTRQKAQYRIPKSNPFLRDFFIQITGPQLDDEPFASFVDDLVNLLANTDMEAVLTDFGRRTRQEDPVVHFYETFLAAYDPKLRESRGVYYTPEPVVSYIVRSVDYLLKTRFNCPQGLADSSKIKIPNHNPSLKVKGKNKTRKKIESHKVLVLDPATGTGTFLYSVIDYIRQQFIDQGNAGMWPGYVKNHLLPRLFGFELLMAPYAVAHFKLSLQLAGRDLPNNMTDQWAYYPTDEERLGVYLTNALEGPHEMTGLPLFTQWVANETNAANDIKQLLPVLVVMGNPPYSVSSSNKGDWINNLMDRYKKAVRSERNIQPLSDDYIKFIRLAHDRIERTEQGIVGIITNHAYLSGLIHRGMREELMKTFTSIYILNLHGNATIGETSPDGTADKNVFDIRQGVSIALFVKEKKQHGPAKVNYFELWGKREGKYEYLRENDVETTNWQVLTPQAPYYFFVPKNFELLDEYEKDWKASEIFHLNAAGVKTRRDYLLVDFDEDRLFNRLVDIATNDDEALLRDRYNIKDTSYWILNNFKEHVSSQNIINHIYPYLYRAFDIRHVYYDKKIIERGDARWPIMRHLLKENIALLTMRRIRTGNYEHFFVTKILLNKDAVSIKDNCVVFPLYLYPSENGRKQKNMLDVSHWSPDKANGGRVPNLAPDFVAEIEQKLGLTFQPVQPTFEDSETSKVFGPEDVFHYIYAIFHSPTYRSRYAEFLKIDFPRVPLTSNVELFRTLCGLGQELVALHLLESSQVSQSTTRYPVAGDSRVEKGYPKYVPPKDDQPGRVNINKTQYFEGIPPEVWGFYVGGYQVLQKWLKDRRGRQLAYDDLTHYQRVVVALQTTMTLMEQIDQAIPEWPIQ
ncbi:hypothetical protein QUF58_10710 [Anaerolineales bacterium HSG24]|nr:hypothetical protein [Anaerolineales bacterium HSG24]